MTELRERERSQERRSRDERPRRRNTSSASGDRRRRRSELADGQSMSPPAQKRRRRSPTDSRSPPRRRDRGSDSPRRNDRRRERSQSEEQRDRRPDRGSKTDAQPRDSGRDQRRHSRSRDTDRRRDRKQYHSTSPPPTSYRDRSPKRDDRSHDRRRDRQDSPPSRRNRAPLPSQLDSFKDEGGVIKTYRNGRGNNENAVAPPTEKEKINLRPTGLLATEANTLSFGTQKITLKYHQPPEARKPDPKRAQWRLFIFKGTETLDTIDLFEKSCWLVGREKAVADLWVQSPGVSGQHAVLQFGAVDDRGGKKVVKLYVLDLESSNGTVLNGEKIPDRRYVEVRGGDVLQFGGSGRDYVVMLPGADEKIKET